jgi:hypothetical protein
MRENGLTQEINEECASQEAIIWHILVLLHKVFNARIPHTFYSFMN